VAANRSATAFLKLPGGTSVAWVVSMPTGIVRPPPEAASLAGAAFDMVLGVYFETGQGRGHSPDSGSTQPGTDAPIAGSPLWARSEGFPAPSMPVWRATVRSAPRTGCPTKPVTAPAIPTYGREKPQHRRRAGFGDVTVINHMYAPRPTPRPFARRMGMRFVGAVIGWTVQIMTTGAGLSMRSCRRTSRSRAGRPG
jgi:hypothetical protein